MPRDVPIGNGSLLVSFDLNYQIRELFWPYVGLENHAVGHPFQVGVWVDGQFRWLSDPAWVRDRRYRSGTLVTQVRLFHPELKLTLDLSDAVDFHENLFLRQCTITDQSGREREVRLLFHQDFHIMGHEVGDTAYYEPDRRAVIHYKGPRWFLINGAVPYTSEVVGPGWRPTTDTFPGLLVGVHQWACGHKELSGREGTWRDAEDGRLSGNSVAQGSVDSTVGFGVRVPARGSQKLYYWLCAGLDFEGVIRINRLVRQRGPRAFLDRTAAYWKLWLKAQLPDLSSLPSDVAQHYQMSLLAIRTQTDNHGAIIAANDSDIGSNVRDTYSYLWPRDGALVANALVQAGYREIPRDFYALCARVLTREGFLLHKYNPDGTLASTWHPWFRDGAKELPIQEDETALVLWSLWRFFERSGEVEFVKPLYRPMIIGAGNFLESYRDLETGLPLPSYDLWEERHGVSAFTVGAVWAGLMAAASFAEAFGEGENAARYRRAAEDMKVGADAYLWQPDDSCFARLVNRQPTGRWEIDRTVDSSLAGLWLFGMYRADDPRIVETMTRIRERLWVNTGVGGIARYVDDNYQRVTTNVAYLPGNPWFVSTLWLAEWYAEVAATPEVLARSLALLKWACAHALPSGVLAEQVDPLTGVPLSVSPLTWSHAGLVTAVHAYLRAQARIGQAAQTNHHVLSEVVAKYRPAKASSPGFIATETRP